MAASYNQLLSVRLTFKETAKLSCKVVVLFYILSTTVLQFQLLHLLTNISMVTF